MIEKYQKKPVVVETLQWTGTTENIDEMMEFMHSDNLTIIDGDLLIETLEGFMAASAGDYVIKGVKGEFYPCKPDIFKLTYEPVV